MSDKNVKMNPARGGFIFEKKDSNPIIDYVRLRPKRNQNFLCVWVGGTGTGKTHSALSFAHNLDPRFTADDVVFTVEEFFARLMHYQELWKKGKKYVKGRVIIFDEAGVGMNSRQWQSYSNKAINAVMQSFRYMCLIVIFTTPDFSFVDVGSRKLFHGYFETCGIDYKKGIAYSKFKIFVRDYLEGSYYPMYPRLYLSDEHKIARITRVGFKKAPQELLDEYELRRHAWASAKYAKFTEGINLASGGKTVKMGSDGTAIVSGGKGGSKEIDLAKLKHQFMKEPGLFLKMKRSGDVVIDTTLLQGTGQFKGMSSQLKLAVKKLYYDEDVKDVFNRVKEGKIPIVKV